MTYHYKKLFVIMQNVIDLDQRGHGGHSTMGPSMGAHGNAHGHRLESRPE